MEVRLPAAALKGHKVLILPLDDHRVQELDVLVSPGIYDVSDEGTIKVRVINTSTRKVSVPALAPVARFVVDPRAYDTDLEYTTDEIFENITVDGTRSQEELEYLKVMLSKRRRLFSSVLGWAHATKQNIATPTIDNLTHAPPCAPSRRRSVEEDATLYEYVNKLRKERLIEPTVSPYNAIPMLIKKPDGTFRVVLDYRALNLLTLKDQYPLPNIDKYLSSLGSAHWFTTGDLLQGFHQVELDEQSKPKTAFSTPWGQFAFTRMPMGLTSSPGAFMRLVDAMTRGLPPGYAYAFVDDIMVPSSGTFYEHIDQVGLVFDKLIEAGFTMKASKVFVGMTEVKYLGFLVGKYGTKPDPHEDSTPPRHGRRAARCRRQGSGQVRRDDRLLPQVHPASAQQVAHLSRPKASWGEGS